MSSYLETTIEFLNAIGIETAVVEETNGFLAHIRIKDGKIELDRQCPVADLLHEAGHIAIFPAAYRPFIQADLSAAQRFMLDGVMSKNLPPDDPLYRAAIQTSDPEATAWAFAIGHHLGIPSGQIIGDDPKHYDGEGAAIRAMLARGGYIGINGLAYAGFCAVNPMSAKHTGRPLYPTLAMWLQH